MARGPSDPDLAPLSPASGAMMPMELALQRVCGPSQHYALFVVNWGSLFKIRDNTYYGLNIGSEAVDA